MDDFESQIIRQMERLRETPLAAIEAQVAEKRAAWHRTHGPGPLPGASPRQAFELLFFDYMGLDPADLTVLSEDADCITWASSNPCPTLEACLRLGLDTRTVCREAYEQSTQAFLDCIDPGLRFGRSYEEIRPYAPYCREWIRRKRVENGKQESGEESRES